MSTNCTYDTYIALRDNEHNDFLKGRLKHLVKKDRCFSYLGALTVKGENTRKEISHICEGLAHGQASNDLDQNMDRGKATLVFSAFFQHPEEGYRAFEKHYPGLHNISFHSSPKK